MTRVSGQLFDESELRQWLQQRRGVYEAELARFPEVRVLEQPIDQLVGAFVSRHRIEPIKLDLDRMYAVDLGETEVWGSGGLVAQRLRVRVGDHPGAPGRSVAVHVPFAGDPELFYLRPSIHTSGYPRGRVEEAQPGTR